MANPQAKEQMRILLAGGVPDFPPHWELVFKIQEECFGMPSLHSVQAATYGSEAAR